MRLRTSGSIPKMEKEGKPTVVSHAVPTVLGLQIQQTLCEEFREIFR